MTPDARDRLVELLPYVYRLRDTALGEPLRALLQVITEQVDVVEADIRQLYDNWFIETCEDWVVPYIGDLIGYQPLHEAAEAGSVATEEGRRLNRILSPRRDVANTIGDRRRKGTLALLEQLAADVAQWPARAVEFFALLGLTQPVKLFARASSANQRRLERGRTIDLRDGDALDRLDGPFDELAHTVSVGRPTSTRTRRRHNIPSVGLFIWRLQPFSITQAPASCIDRARNRYTFSILGNDTPLITQPIAEPEPTHIADEMNVPAFIRRRAFDERTPDYYGPSRSLFVWCDAERHPVPLEQIVPADLSAWAYRPQGAQVAVDPVLGRIVFSPRNAPESGVWVSYSHGFSDRLGGGEYERPVPPASDRPVYQVGTGEGQHRKLMEAVEKWRREKRDDAKKRDAVIEITDSGVYEEPIEIDLDPDDRLEVRAAQRTRPVIRLLNWYSNRPDSMQIRGKPLTEDDYPDEGGQAPRLLLDGLLITGRGIRITGLVGRVTIRHCTLVPGWSIGADCEPDSEGQPSVDLADTPADLLVERSILGAIRVNENEVDTEPIVIRLSDSILDATSSTHHALSGPDGRPAHAVATILRSTVFGRVCVHAIELGEDAIFVHELSVARRQTGCLRFCSVTPDSRTPRRYHCQPDLVRAAAAPDTGAQERETLRVRPQFNSVRYGTPTYAQLAETCAPEITTGAHDESEMGAFHDLFQPQRQANLRTRLDQYTPAGMGTGIFFVT
ncbi:MAG: hypothetical protein ACRD0K_00445 [Egibacteraceae bacterium]